MNQNRQDPTVVWACLLTTWAAVALNTLAWCAGRSASWLTGHGWAGPDLGFDFTRRVVQTGGPAGVHPDVPVGLVWTLTVAYPVAVIAVVVLVVWRARKWWNRRDSTNIEHLEVPVDALRSLTVRGMVDDIPRLRPPLANVRPRRLQPEQVGWLIGRHPDGRELRGTWESGLIGIMAPRTGKTTRIAGPLVIDAPGPCLATSTKADLYAMTHGLRAKRGDVWLFDPCALAGGGTPTFTWNPLSQVRDWTAADRVARNLSAAIPAAGDNQFFVDAAHDLITSLVFAAAVTEEGTLLDVARWLIHPVDTPERILEAAGLSDAAARLASCREMQALQTRDSIWAVARTMARCLAEPALPPWITPRRDLPEFDPYQFVTSSDTLYLLSRSDHGGIGPVVATLTDQLLHAADRLAGPSRLDVPFLVVLDEAANICKIPHLPALYSTAGDRGIVLVSLFQSRPQGEQVWPSGFRSMWSAATYKLVGPGVDDPGTLNDMQTLIGSTDTEYKADGGGVSRPSEPLMSASQVRSMGKGTALLLADGCPAVTVTLESVHEGKHRKTVAESVAAARVAHRAALTVPAGPVMELAAPRKVA